MNDSPLHPSSHVQLASADGAQLDPSKQIAAALATKMQARRSRWPWIIIVLLLVLTLGIGVAYGLQVRKLRQAEEFAQKQQKANGQDRNALVASRSQPIGTQADISAIKTIAKQYAGLRTDVKVDTVKVEEPEFSRSNPKLARVNYTTSNSFLTGSSTRRSTVYLKEINAYWLPLADAATMPAELKREYGFPDPWQ